MFRNLLRKAYFALPLSAYRRYQIVGICFQLFPFLFRKLPEFQRWKISSKDRPRPMEKILEHRFNMVDAGIITIPASNSPRVSIIIPVFGEIEYTLLCLRSITTSLTRVPFEVIVVDDCSPDTTREVLRGISGLRLVCSELNQGFIKSCNLGAEHARGEFLHFLNNDTQVCERWLDELDRTFADFSDVGLAGSKLVYPNGKLQEAGGIIFQDGSAWNFGRGEDPSHPKFNYAREVDYISGASILIRKDLFLEFGGFDELYIPAYCEDADIALKIRNRGLRVMYQPLSVVVHYEGISSGTDVRQGVKSYQIENSKKLFDRWHRFLALHGPRGVDIDKVKDRGFKRHALVLDICTPTPDRDAGSVITLNLMLLLRQMGFQVTFIPVGNFRYLSGYTQDLQRAGIEVLHAPYVISMKQHLRRVGDRYELALVFRPSPAKEHFADIRKYCRSAKILYHPADLHYLRMSREAELHNDTSKMHAAIKMKRLELEVFLAADASIVPSFAELELLRTEISVEHIRVFPLIMDIAGSAVKFCDRRDIVFIGGFQHPPNIDAVLFFVTDVMPLIRQRHAAIKFYVVGSNPPPEILALQADDVIVTGFVADLHPLLDKMRVSVAPLRYGAGIKGKIGSAMTVGLPVVATSLAAEGMLLTHNENILIADSPEAFAKAIMELYDDEFLWDRISGVGLAFAKSMWGSEVAWNSLRDILHDVGIEVTRDKYPLKLYSSDFAGNSNADPDKIQQAARA